MPELWGGSHSRKYVSYDSSPARASCCLAKWGNHLGDREADDKGCAAVLATKVQKAQKDFFRTVNQARFIQGSPGWWPVAHRAPESYSKFINASIT